MPEKTYFVITRHEFDSLENHDPHYEVVDAVVEDALEAKKVVDAFMAERYAYEGWDGEVYPYWTVEEAPSGATALARLPKKAPPPPPVEVVESS